MPGVPAEVLARHKLIPPLFTEATPEVTAEVTPELLPGVTGQQKLLASPKINPPLLRSPSSLKG
jgi:hypothetical protein